MTVVRCAALTLFVAAVAAGLRADDPPCEPGYRWAEEVRHKEVVRYVCKEVPDVKKTTKIVYTTKDAPFCLKTGSPLLPGHQPGCGACAGCKGPYSRKVLVKTEITCEEPTTKCVAEKVVELVAYTVKCKVSCPPRHPPVAAPPAGAKHVRRSMLLPGFVTPAAGRCCGRLRSFQPALASGGVHFTTVPFTR